MGALLLFLLAGAFPVDANNSQLVIFKTPAFILLAAALVISLLRCCWKKRHSLSLHKLGFHLSHLGVVLIIIGAFIGFKTGERHSLAIPLNQQIAQDRFLGADGQRIKFDFKLAASDFKATYYPPEYALYRPQQADKKTAKHLGTFTASEPQNNLELKDGRKIPLNELQLESGWKPTYMLPNGDMLQLSGLTPKHFEATLHFSTSDKKRCAQKIMINHPITYQGWRFYLTDYDIETQQYLILSARRDPGRKLVIPGLWAVIVGVPLICFAKAEKERK